MSVLAPSPRKTKRNAADGSAGSDDAETHLKRLLIGEELEILRQLEARADDLWARVGTTEALRESVTAEIVNVLRDAGVKDHERLADVLAPLLIATLREEIRNSKDMMVDALYPITGRLVSAGIRVAMQDMLAKIEQRLEQTLSVKRWRIKVQALVTRQSEAELLLRASAPFQINRIMVIHRPSGLLIADALRNPAPGDAEADGDRAETSDGGLVGGLLSAIMSFAEDAFDPASRGELKSLAFGASRVYVDSSPALLIATVADGVEPKGFATRLDTEVLALRDRWGDLLRGYDGSLEQDANAALRADLERFFDAVSAIGTQTTTRKPRLGRWLKMSAVPLALLMLFHTSVQESDPLPAYAQSVAAAAAALPAMAGYPVTVSVDKAKNALDIRGLTPDAKTRGRLEAAIAGAIGPVRRTMRLGIVPSATQRVVERTERRVIVRKSRAATPVRSALDRLVLWTRRHAVFFDKGDGFADAAKANRKFDRLAALLQSAKPAVRLRVTGHSDWRGSDAAKRKAAGRRARAAIKALVARGVARNSLVAANASDSAPVTEDREQSLANRRVEFSVIRLQTP